mmetsp:Transcript_28980/g.33091  ORF Transcript_28980/g.33091 Transcript_28980/m.33091 type:complete len:176 (-) Transcript_28980:302-829(-)
MQLNHREEYEKLCNEHEVDKSSVLKTIKGQVFMIEMVDKDHPSERNLSGVDIDSQRSDQDHPNAKCFEEKSEKCFIGQEKTESSCPKKSLNQIANEIGHARLGRNHNKAVSRENSFVRQSSMLSEISQSINVNNLADLFEKNAFNCDNMKQDSFYLNHRLLRANSSFYSNGCFSK